MQETRLLITIIVTSLVLVLAIIHLGVSIGVLARFSRYGDTFRPERGLAAFNLVISIYGLLIGGFGLFSVLTQRGILGKIVALATVALAFFAFVSLITALIINSKAINYQSSRFSNNMQQYVSSQQSRDVIDNIQTTYNCCGNNIWIDWAPIGLNATSSATTTTTATGATTTGGSGLTTTTISTTGATSAGSGTAGTTTTGGAGTSAGTTTTGGAGTSTDTTTTGGAETSAGTTTTVGAGGATTGSVAGTTTTGSSGSTAGRRLLSEDAEDTIKNPLSSNKTSNDSNVGPSPLQQAIRRKRQSTGGLINGLPISSSITLPQSCCTNSIAATDNLNNLYCIVNPNNGSNSIHNDGCTKATANLAIGYSLGFAVINTFLVVLALASVPLLLQKDPFNSTLQSTYTGQTMPQDQQQYGNGGYDSTGYAPETSYNNSYGGYDATGYAPEISYNNYNGGY